ncbi:AAA family ATPase [Chryseobacterium sp. Ch-15]|uniref:AAA family ATPase n=1 Tax=Chryseobacterium muglaense TaxID=2893752 RepID=A0A9Q3YTW3_9FLAO|nr:AAA family ATPase [Chryseobacterium muglaense]MBD3906886.1 AAA family ATPase [Chryseobacterium muglaense]MCC9033040.1 AAA family ATPase [Chryseobacterium muglaense]MCM2556622.1 AAA family ATPase [Chryseobacterium muglaense]
MALNLVTPKLIVKHLILVGSRKDYDVNFERGLNIIYGDSDTGKSSILNLINYCLGSSNVDLYDEIEVTGNYCLLEVELRGETFTVKRNIFKPKNEIEVYKCLYNNIENHFPKYYSPNYSQTSEDGYFSDFLLSAMNIPVIRLKQSPTRDISKMTRLSFRDIFKFNFLDQDKIGSKKLFGENYPVLVKLKETFKLMFNALDSQILELEEVISEKNTIKNELEKRNTSISSFLRETEVESLTALSEQLEDIDSEYFSIQEDLKNIDKEIIKDSEHLNYLRRDIQEKEKEILLLQQELQVNDQAIKQNIALRNEYSNDIRKINSTIEVIEKFPHIEDRNTACPVCEQLMHISKLKEHFTNSNSESIKGELNSLRRRQREIEKIYDFLKDSVAQKERFIKEKIAELEEFRYLLDKQSIDIVSPFITKRDVLSRKVGSLESERKNLKHFYKIRMQQSQNQDDIENLANKIIELNTTLKDLKENAPNLDSILKDLGKKVKDFLNFIGVKNVYDVSISPKTNLPIIRNRDYENITSGGVRTLASVGYFLSLVIYASENSVNYPSFLMIDTIAKYIGKTSTKEKDILQTDLQADQEEGMSDSKKYENIYKYLLSLNKSSNSFQLIVVDNDIPESMSKELKPYIRKHFTDNKFGIDSEIGFINDAFQAGGKIGSLFMGIDDEIDIDLFYDDEEEE